MSNIGRLSLVELEFWGRKQLKRTGTPLCLLVGAVLAGVWIAGCGDSEPEPGGLRVLAEGERVDGVWVDEPARLASFKGIPFAAPPTGERRWRPPESIEPQSGVRKARDYGPRCPQPSGAAESAVRRLATDLGGDPDAVPQPASTDEDCLHLNVWTSNLGGEEPQPVLVWIHGGSNIEGGADTPAADGSHLARRGVVVVSFNYRLGILGFLAHPALVAESPTRSAGNYGLLDQIAALEWVQRNIQAFGGDPDRVTLAGGSSGGADVLYLMASPLAEGLFHRAISQSGAPLGDLRELVVEAIRGVRLEELLEVRGEDSALEAMRRVPAEQIVETSTEYLNQPFDCAPVVDGWAIPAPVARIFQSGGQAAVPVLIGNNSDEWSTLGRFSEPVSMVGFKGWLRSSWGRWAGRAERIYAPKSDAEIVDVVERWQTDEWFTCPGVLVAKSMKTVEAPSYLYQFSRSAPGEVGTRLGGFHGAEVAYVFDNLEAESWVPRKPTDQAFADTMVGYWTNFAATGDPNGPELPEWPRYADSGGQYLEFGDEISTQTDLRSAACELWNRRLDQLLGAE